MDDDEKIMLDDEIEDLSTDRIFIAFERACRKLDTDGLDEHNDEHMDVFGEELKRLAVTDIINDLIAEGEIEVIGINEDGDLIYKAVDKR